MSEGLGFRRPSPFEVRCDDDVSTCHPDPKRYGRDGRECISPGNLNTAWLATVQHLAFNTVFTNNTRTFCRTCRKIVSMSSSFAVVALVAAVASVQALQTNTQTGFALVNGFYCADSLGAITSLTSVT